MRPVRKGASPVVGDFNHYRDAKPELVSRLGPYCSYCERKIVTLLAVEHIEPKNGSHARPELKKRWGNFLLACTNCNSTKSNRAVDLAQIIFPDRDNTFVAYVYEDDGTVTIAQNTTPQQQVAALNMLSLVGLDKPMQELMDANGRLVALDRAAQRMETIAIAQQALSWLQADPNNENMKSAIIEMALQAGYFSIWMKVFDINEQMKIRFIDAFSGTQASGCFDMTSGAAISPAPNPDALLSGGKI